MRQIIKMISVTKIFRKADSQKPNHYDMENLTSRKNTLFADWVLGEEFVAEALDSVQRKVKCGYVILQVGNGELGLHGILSKY